MQKETLHTCPTCGIPNFTERGLKAHRCKSPSAAPGGEPTSSREQPQALQVVAPGTISEDSQIGEQLTAQYHKAVSGMREVLIFGAMLKQVENTLSNVDKVSARGKQLTGNGVKGKGLKGWLATYAPEISRSTAYRFLGITEAVMDQYEMIVGKQIAKKFDLPTLVTSSPESLPAAARTKQEELFDFVSGTSQRSWLDQFKKEPEKGGKRERPNGTKRRTDAEKDFDDAMAWYEYGFLDLKQTYLNDTLWRTLPDVELANVADLVKLFAKKLDDVCQSRKIVPSKIRTWDKEEDAQ
jgi:hypothetical protein